MKRGFVISSLFAVLLSLMIGCDTVQPGDSGTLVVEAYFDVGKPLPAIRIARATPLTSRTANAALTIVNATVSLKMGDTHIEYHPDPNHPGVYQPLGASSFIVPAGVAYELDIVTPDKTIQAIGLTPPRIQIHNIRVEIPDTPVSAVFLDSLDLGLDSLNLGLNTRTGFIYPVQVSVDWIPENGVGTGQWIETNLQPLTLFSSTIVDFFLLPSDIFPEDSAVADASGIRTWRGIYAVPVPKVSDPIPIHSLRVSLIRAFEQYAQYSSSTLDPVNREPMSHLTGAVGFVGGVSIDSIRVNVPQ